MATHSNHIKSERNWSGFSLFFKRNLFECCLLLLLFIFICCWTLCACSLDFYQISVKNECPLLCSILCTYFSSFLCILYQNNKPATACWCIISYAPAIIFNIIYPERINCKTPQKWWPRGLQKMAWYYTPLHHEYSLYTHNTHTHHRSYWRSSATRTSWFQKRQILHRSHCIKTDSPTITWIEQTTIHYVYWLWKGIWQSS